MSALHQMVPLVLLVQFVVVLAAFVASMLLADPQLSFPHSIRRATAGSIQAARRTRR